MKQKQRFLLPLLMAIVMMAMSPTKVWADDYTITPLAGTENTELPVILVTSENYESLGLAAKHIGYYALSTYDNLKWFSDKVNNDNANYKSAKVVLTRDIDAGCDATNQWTPIGTYETPFLGSFDGNGKTISNIYYDGENYAIGFFGYLGKKDFNDHIVIENLTIKNSTFKTTDFYAGGIVGWCRYSPVNIRNCHVIETTIQAGIIRGDGVIESGLYAGGIVACYELESTNTEPAYIENCSISGSVVSQCYIGGIAGSVGRTDKNQTPLIIRNCYTSAAVSGLAQLDNVYAGGAFGKIGTRTRVSNIYSRGTVTYSNSSDCVSAFAGMIVQSALIRNCFYDNQVTQLPSATYGDNTQLGPNCTGKTPEEFKSGEVTYLLNDSRSIGTEAFPLVWYQTLGADGDAYPTFDATHGIVYGDYDENTCIAHRYANDATTLTKTTPTHTLSHVEGTQANCLVAGNKEYWSCSACERLFLDEACNEEAIAQDVVIPANNDHLYSTDFTDGLKDCSRCGAVIEMEAAVQVSAENYSTFGFTAENYSAFVGYYAISKAGHLYWLADEVNNGRAEEGIKVVLTTDIIVNDGTFDADGNYSPRNGANKTTPRKWSPIGTWNSPFCGTFDGNGHSISGLYVKDESKSHVGVIGSASNSIIQNLGVKDFYFVVMGNVGGICGDCFSTIINKCYATGYIDGAYSGGICGTLDDLKRDGKAMMSQCWANCHFLRSRLNSGGICGVLGGEAVMEDCFSMVNEPTDIVEGICYGGSSGSTIINCYTNYTYPANSTYYGIIMNSASKVDMATGEICWKLNGSVDDNGKWTAGPVDGSQAWYQKLGEDGDAAPVLTKAADGSNTVYWGYKNCTELGYDNKSMSATPLDIHDFTAHTPAATADEQTGLYATVCGYGCGTIEHGVKVIKDYAPNAEGMAKNLVLTVDAEGKYSVAEPIALTDANQFKDVQVDITAPAAPTYTRTMTSQWGTLVVPFDVVLNDGQQPFCCYKITSIADDQLTLKKLSGTLRANTPVLVRMNSDVLGQTDNLSLQASNCTLKAVKEVNPVAIGADDNYSLAGTYVKLEPASSDYFISNNSFWSVGYMLGKYPTAHVAVSPFRAYIKSTATSEAKQLVIGAYDDETTGINQIENGTLYMVNGTCYNMQGQKLSAPRRGLNIINGKKVMVK